MRTVMNEYPRDSEMWMEALKAKQIQSVTSGLQTRGKICLQNKSVCDIPAVAFAEDLIDAYPNAKIILTNRDMDSWHKSISRTLLPSRFYWLHGLLQHIDWATGLVHPLRVKLWQCLFDDDFEKNGRAAMRRHYEMVREHARIQGREVLETQLTDGWEALCNFLGVDVPKQPYPNENSGGDFIPEMQERARLRMRAVALKWLRIAFWIGLLGLVVGLGVWDRFDHRGLRVW
ncbi:MAG: hypothetical protein Q9225_004208 [Loekoesia sp. 1 TL-2023]